MPEAMLGRKPFLATCINTATILVVKFQHNTSIKLKCLVVRIIGCFVLAKITPVCQIWMIATVYLATISQRTMLKLKTSDFGENPFLIGKPGLSSLISLSKFSHSPVKVGSEIWFSVFLSSFSNAIALW